MAESKQLTDDELLAFVEREEANCVTHQGGLLSEQRQKAMDYYYGQPFGDEVEGRSQVVTTEVKDAVEGILPPLMAIFTSGDEVVRFEPQNPDDEEKAQQATDYVNYLFSRQNNGFMALYCMFKDALLQKNGYVKVYWEQYESVEKETYENLNDMQFLALLQDDELELLEHSEKPDPQGTLHDAKFKRTRKHGKVCIDPLPPEEVLVSMDAANVLPSARFVEHRTKKSISEIREMGYDVDDDIADSAANADTAPERIARLKNDNSFLEDDATTDPAARRVWLCEAYLKVDADGDGIAELRKITKVGKTLLDNEEFDSIPIIGCTFIPMPHKHYGLSLYDLVGDLQRQKSAVMRQLLDNAYRSNNQRLEILDGMVNMTDALTSRPGGIIRVKSIGAVKPIDAPLLGAPFYNLLEYLDKIKVNRVGARDFGDAVDPNALNAKAHTAELVSNAAQERINLMARIAAETAVKEIFLKILELVSKHQDKRQVVKLRGKWVEVSPREWKDRFDMTVTVGLGTGSQQAKVQNVMMLGQLVQGIMAAGLGGRVVTEGNIYQLAHIAAKATFPKEADLLFTNPAQLPPPQPHPDHDTMKLQLQKDKQDTAAQLKQMKMGFDMQMDDRDKAYQSSLEHFKAMVSKVEQDSKHQNEIQKTAIKVSSDEKQSVTDAVVQLKIAEKQATDNYGGIVVQGIVDVLKDFQAQQHERDAQQKDHLVEMLKLAAAEREVIRDQKGKATGTRIRKA